MAITISDIALACLSYIQSADAALASATTQQKAWIARDINAALDEARHLNPAAFRVRYSGYLAAPATVSVVVGSGTDYVTIASPATGAIVGHSLSIGGRFYSTYDRDSTKWYVTPRPAILLSTGTHSATWYYDCLEIPYGAEVGDPVLLDDDTELISAGSFERLRRLAYRYGSLSDLPGIDYGARASDVGVDDYQMVAGTPGFWSAGAIQSQYVTANSAIRSRGLLRVAPLPSTAHGLSYWLGQTFVQLGSSDLSSTAITIDLPGGPGAESLIIPLVMARWAAAPWCRFDPAVREQLNAQAATARVQIARVRAVSGNAEIVSGY